MRRPVIGVTSWTRLVRSGNRERPAETLPRTYVEALEEAGALPVLLPNATDPALAPACLDLVDGLLLSGGDDPHPRLFGEEPHPNLETVDERRDRFELALVAEARARGMAVFGICRGVQILNVALGGDMVQDIGSQTDAPLRHTQRTLDDTGWHAVDVLPGSRVAELTGRTRLFVNSYHHQACRRPGEGLRVCATAPDGLIEALEDPSRPFFLGVQWHPEVGRQRPDSGSLQLFTGFVAAAREQAALASKG